jgi:NTE family protein
MQTGLVLSGGGARGVAHLGVYKALLERDIRPDIISGTSAGALVGAFLGAGYSPEEVLEIGVNTNFLKLIRPVLGGSGLLRIETMEPLLRSYLPDDSFEALSIPLVVAATDLAAGEVVYFRTGELIRPILASCCLPGIFEPIEWQQRSLIDGGVLNNMPVEPIRTQVERIIGSHCNPFEVTKPIKGMREVLSRSFILAVHAKTKERFSACDLLIEPPALRDYSILDMNKARELFVHGYKQARKVLADHNVSA